MANHQSTCKRMRANETKRLRNRYQLKTCRTAIKQLKKTTNKPEAADLFRTVSAMLDKLAARNIIHKNKAANNKSSLNKYINSL
ncbi:MAG: 30S ribosomal protein S20 [Bacteroidota bacterium]